MSQLFKDKNTSRSIVRVAGREAELEKPSFKPPFFGAAIILAAILLRAYPRQHALIYPRVFFHSIYASSLFLVDCFEDACLGGFWYEVEDRKRRLGLPLQLLFIRKSPLVNAKKILLESFMQSIIIGSHLQAF